MVGDTKNAAKTASNSFNFSFVVSRKVQLLSYTIDSGDTTDEIRQCTNRWRVSELDGILEKRT